LSVPDVQTGFDAAATLRELQVQRQRFRRDDVLRYLQRVCRLARIERDGDGSFLKFRSEDKIETSIAESFDNRSKHRFRSCSPCSNVAVVDTGPQVRLYSVGEIPLHPGGRQPPAVAGITIAGHQPARDIIPVPLATF